jgi:hypothetical protein
LLLREHARHWTLFFGAERGDAERGDAERGGRSWLRRKRPRSGKGMSGVELVGSLFTFKAQGLPVLNPHLIRSATSAFCILK